MDGEDEDGEFSLPKASIESEDHSDVDPFEELGIGTRTNVMSTKEDGGREYDVFSGLIEEEEEEEEEQGLDLAKAEATYVMLLQTVWVDGILDPAEVRLLAKKRSELNISFERHLELVDGLLG